MKKLPYLFAIFIFASIFVIGFMQPAREWRYDNAIKIVGQIGLGISIILFFIISKRKNV